MNASSNCQSNFSGLRYDKVFLLLCLAVSLLTGCAAVQYTPDYKSKLAAAQKDCKGDEIVGIWVAKVKGSGISLRQTFLFRPDGTGLARQIGEGFVTTAAAAQIGEFRASWRYVGGGVWSGTGHEPFPPYDTRPHIYTIHYANGELLVEDRQELISTTETQCAVYERAL